MKRSPNIQALIVAHHEAGHAVIAHMLGCRVGRVCVDEDNGATLIKWSGRGEQRIERQILSNLAGPFAQRRFAPRSHWRSRSHAGFASGYDFDNVTGLIFALQLNGKSYAGFWVTAWIKRRTFLGSRLQFRRGILHRGRSSATDFVLAGAASFSPPP